MTVVEADAAPAESVVDETAIPDTTPIQRVEALVLELDGRVEADPKNQQAVFIRGLWSQISDSFSRVREIADKLRKPEGPSAADLKKMRTESDIPEVVALREKLIKLEETRKQIISMMNEKITGIVIEELDDSEAEALRLEYTERRTMLKGVINSFGNMSSATGDALGIEFCAALDGALPALRGPGAGSGATGGSGGTPRKRYASIALSNGDTAKTMSELVQKLTKLKVKTTVQDLYNLADEHGNTFPVAENLTVTVVEKTDAA